MKSCLFICFFAATLLAAQGHYGALDLYKDEAYEALAGTRDEPLPKYAPMVQEDSHNMSCDCGAECDKLHVSRLPHDVRDEDKYLSYENYPVLCRDAASLYLPRPAGNQTQQKYICKQVFDCCRRCNQEFYACLGEDYEYGLCMRRAYKCMCDCIDRKSNELPHKP